MKYKIENNTLTAFGDIESGDGSEFITVFSELEAIHDEIIIELHTYGGSVFDGNLIYNAIAKSKAQITINIIGVCASMGAIIALSVDDVYMVENGYMMIHAPSGGAFGTADDIENNIKLLRSIERNFMQKLQEKTEQDENYIREWLKSDTWFDAEEALNEGLIKGILHTNTGIKANFNPNKLTRTEALERFTALYKNSNNFNFLNMDLKRVLAKKLNLSATTSDTKIVQEVEEAQELRENLISLLELDDEATDEEIIERVTELLDLSKETEEEKQEEAEALLRNVIARKLVDTSQRGYFMKMFKIDFKGTKQHLNNLLKPMQAPNISALISKSKSTGNGQKKKSEWDLDDYRMFAPQELAQNPQLYSRLKKEKFHK